MSVPQQDAMTAASLPVLVSDGLLPVAQNPARRYLATLAEVGRASVMSKLKQVAAMCGVPGEDGRWLDRMPWHQLRSEHLRIILARFGEEKYSPATIALVRAALRGVAREAFDVKLLPSDELQRILNVKTVRGSRLPAGRDLRNGELMALIGSCDDGTVIGVRDAAVLALLFGAGLRRRSVAELELASLDTQEMTVRFVGKGNKEHQVPLPHGTVDALNDWLDLRGHAPGPLFYPILKNGKICRDRQITDQAIYNIVKARAGKASVDKCSPHDFRRTFITTVLDKTGDLAVAQDLAGHANPQTTKRYDRRGERAKRAAIDMLHVPYAPKHLPAAQLQLPEAGETPKGDENDQG